MQDLLGLRSSFARTSISATLAIMFACTISAYGQSSACAATQTVCPGKDSQAEAISSQNGTSFLVASWPPKAPATLRFAASLSNDLEAQYIREGYEFWAYEVNLAGGIPIGNTSRMLTVDLQFVNDKGDPAFHIQTLLDAVAVGKTDFVLGGSTNFAYQDWNVSQITQRLTMLCCHGPQTVYQAAAAAAMQGQGNGLFNITDARNYLFGIQYASEQYTNALIRQIALNQKSKLIAVVALNSDKPNLNLFPNTTCEAATTLISNIYASGQYNSPPNQQLFLVDAAQSGNLTYFRDVAKNIKNASFNGNKVDTVIGCTMEADGANLLAALQMEEVSLKAVFTTEAPLNPSTVATLTQCQNITMADVLTASQWHPELPFLDTSPDTLWPNPTAFASAFQSWNPTGASATDTHASAAAAGFALQVAIGEAFVSCDLSTWTGDGSELLYGRNWTCGPNIMPATGYKLIIDQLKLLRRDTFFGTIQFDANQRNTGRSTLTLQLLGSSNKNAASSFGSWNYGCDADKKTLLLQQIVLPSDYETKAIVLPRPPRSYDTPCPDGQGLDANNDCQLCPLGTARGTLDGTSSVWTCVACNLTSYADAQGQSQCSLCPDGTRTNILGATSILECVCVDGYYNETGQTGVPCSTCPQGATCAGGTAPPYPLPGYWTDRSSPETVATVFTCNPPQTCVNNPDTNQTCADGWGDNVCSLCGYNNGDNPPVKHVLVFGSCIHCDSPVGAFFLFVAILLLWCFINIFVGRSWESIGLAVDWMQLMSMVGNINAPWPSSLQVFFSVAQFFAFEVNVIGWQCVAPHWNFLYDMILQFTLPWFFIGCWLFLWVIHFVVRRMRSRGSQPQFRSDSLGSDRSLSGDEPAKSKSSFYSSALSGVVAASSVAGVVTDRIGKIDWSVNAIIGRMLNVLEITYLASTSFAMSGLSSIWISGGRYLTNYPYTEQTTAVIAVGAVGLAFYGVAFPLFLAVRLWSFSPDSIWRRSFKSDCRRYEDPGGFREKENVKMFGWLYEKFRVERYYMAHIHLLHRFIFIALVNLLVDPAIQLVLSVIVALAFAALFILTRPYFLTRLNILHSALYLSIVVMLGCGAAFYTPYATWEGVGWTTTFEIVGFLVIGIAAAMFLWIAAIEILEHICSLLSKEALYQQCDGSGGECDKTTGDEEFVRELAEVFCPVRLWSWVQEHMMMRTGKRLRRRTIAWCAVRRLFGFKNQTVIEAIPTDPGCEHDLALFRQVSHGMKGYLNEDNKLSMLSTQGDAILWRQLVSQYPELLAFLFNEDDRVAGHWNAFFQIFYGWYWRMYDTREVRRRVLKPIIRGLATLRAVRSRKARVTSKKGGPGMKSLFEGRSSKPLLRGAVGSNTFRTTPPEVHNVDRIIQRQHMAVIANWLAWRPDASDDRQQFMRLLRSIGFGKHVSWEEKLFRLLSFSTPSWFRQGAQRSAHALPLAFNLESRSNSLVARQTGIDIPSVTDTNETQTTPGSIATGGQTYVRSLSGDSAWTNGSKDAC